MFDPTRGANQPKARFAYLFPTADSALIQVRLKASLSDAEQAQRDLVDPRGGARCRCSAPPTAARTRSPARRWSSNDLASQITGSIAGLLIAALLVMAATLLIVFRSRLRLLPLAIALAAAGITFGVTVAGRRRR